MSRTRIKICGITAIEDAQAAIEAGVDALGFVFYPKSSRALPLSQAIEISSMLPAFVSSVALLVNADNSFIHAILNDLKPSYLQFHGDESAQECAQWRTPYIKAVRMQAHTDTLSIMAEHQNAWCRGILLDAYHPSIPGGTGETFDWSRIPEPQARTRPLILAGGLTPENIETAIRQVHPWAVDVSSGVEYAPGRKCPATMRAFIQGVLNAAVPLPR